MADEEMNMAAGEMDPMMAMEDKKDEKKSEKSKKTDGTQESIPKEHIMTPCCCCLCVCSNEYTVGSSCCGCFPIKCGVIAIGIFTVLLTIYLITMNYFLIMNEYVHWYYPVVLLVLYIPLIIGSSFFIVFFSKDTQSSRGKLFVACQFGIISTALACVWILSYYVWIYKGDAVYSGMGNPSDNVYTKQSKKFYLFVVLAETAALCSAYAYFICVTNRYTDNMKGKNE
jgi:hypothetical protein